jgi:hypothetical protein
MPKVVKQLIVWAVETVAAATLIGVLMYLLLGGFVGPGTHGLLSDVFRYAAVTFVVFMWGSAYLLTTAVASVVCRTWKSWTYPIVAMILFIAHVHFFANGWAAGDSSVSHESFMVQYVGACIVLACDLLGNLLLTRWDDSMATHGAAVGRR